MKKKKGLVCESDAIAAVISRELELRKIKVPQELAVTGYGNMISSKYLTTVEQFPEKMGQEAAKLLLNIIKGEKISNSTIKISPKLLVRNSSVLNNAKQSNNKEVSI